MNRRNITALSVLCLLCLCLFFLALCTGSVSIPLSEVFSAIFRGDAALESPAVIIVRELRLPRAMTAILSGSALAVSGLLMQTFFRNPLAGPFVLGINSGASLGVAVFIFLGAYFERLFDFMPWLRQFGTASSAVIGAGLVFLVIYLASLRIGNNTTLLILGLMFGYAASGFVSLLIYFGRSEQVQGFLFWSFGSFARVNSDFIPVFSLMIISGLFLAGVTAKNMNLMLLGENYAFNLGLNVAFTRRLMIGISSLLAGLVTAYCGPVAFLGIAVPHLCRRLLLSSDHRFLVPACILCGAALALLSDIIAGWPGSHQSLPLNAVTSIFGAPVVIWVILSQNSRNN
jgi:iron complex transport system permease protein